VSSLTNTERLPYFGGDSLAGSDAEDTALQESQPCNECEDGGNCGGQFCNVGEPDRASANNSIGPRSKTVEARPVAFDPRPAIDQGSDEVLECLGLAAAVLFPTEAWCVDCHQVRVVADGSRCTGCESDHAEAQRSR
jgi:hypothetical protein